ncbi:dienelactone hydrolase family protein [Paracoccus aminovorans]|uniref:dienelactone hydrolase family protein n=1 Tax=Paracoccus aminovorans TaxID=34004 RepID=UPI00078444CC|nr:dienelactone hydrolase family protein [Paracoccus aminovorans]MDQ7775855.1 dienelactone hydrolase family protein [Paracoccus aminovorans]
MRKPLILLAALLGLVLAGLGLNTARNYAGWQPAPDTPAARLARLAPHWRLLRPDTPGPHPVVVLLSGCDGVRDNMDYWARQFTAMGRAALILDSHAPRGLDKAQAWRAVCAAQVLPGSERAGDLAVALAALRDMPGIDATQVAVLGASHGGWTAMELLHALSAPVPPPGLTDWPAPPASLAAQLGPAVLLYPYCGLVSTADGPWPAQVRVLMLLAGRDSITDPAACRATAADQLARGTDLTLRIDPEADHGFDQSERSRLSPLAFNPEATAWARARVLAFVRGFALAAEGL